MGFQDSPETRQLTNKELEALTNITNNGNVFDKCGDFFINETIKEITISINLDKEQIKEINKTYAPNERMYVINKKKLELLNKKNKLQNSIDVELEILEIENKIAEFEAEFGEIKELRDGLLNEIERKEKDIEKFKKLLKKKSK